MKNRGATVIVCSLALGGCSEVAATRPARLLGGLRGGSSPAEAGTVLGKTPGTWKVIEKHETPPTSNRPRYSSLTASVGEVSESEHPGELVIVFFNERLLETRFYPTDFDGYRAAVERSLGQQLDMQKKSEVGDNLAVWIAADDNGRRFIAFEDTTVAQEQADWIGRHG